MKAIVILALLSAAAYFGNQRMQHEPAAEIENPVFAEIRLQMPIEGR